MTPRVDVVLLAMGDRPEAEALAQKTTLLGQEEVEVRIVVVGNGCVPQAVPPGALAVALPENIGIPGGRNAGADTLRRIGRPGSRTGGGSTPSTASPTAWAHSWPAMSRHRHQCARQLRRVPRLERPRRS
ncbi:hypothetical protein [Streptomyces sp. x-80]|uniref:hypothetical protein n=1 Tax=Streptomyces sp. x-80 TaxID=2789282 RepID=UPI00397F6803